jgi:hypothetical protein
MRVTVSLGMLVAAVVDDDVVITFVDVDGRQW